MLLNLGAAPKARDKSGQTALMLVAKYPAIPNDILIRFFGLLLDGGADPSLVDGAGRTAPEIFMVIECPKLADALDVALAQTARATARQRLLDRLASDQRSA